MSCCVVKNVLYIMVNIGDIGNSCDCCLWKMEQLIQNEINKSRLTESNCIRQIHKFRNFQSKIFKCRRTILNT